MPKKYPPLTHSESVSILKALGFYLKKTKGGHEQWEGIIDGATRKVTLQVGSIYTVLDITSHIKQSGVRREAYYGATRQSAKKIGL